MNLVKSKFTTTTTTVGELVGDNLNQTAFVGKCGGGKEGLYLITYSSIVFASNPVQVWSSKLAEVEIDHFCNVEIKEI